jgi:site-specific DNA-methyltransferase (adenine-specific)
MKLKTELFTADCLEFSRTLTKDSFDLVYLDPPFFTQKTHSLTSPDRTKKFNFCDEWNTLKDYSSFLEERLIEFRRLLKPTGSLFFHCDVNASHNIRLLLDNIFGTQNFRSEIIWYYRRWSNSQKTPIPNHQTIFFYSKTSDYKYNQIFEDYSPSTNVDQILQRRERDSFGKAVYARDSSGKILNDIKKKGVPIGDVWDIPFLNPKAKERVGYPTQKPILLLERIISLATDEGDCVLDPFSGSGTTLLASHFLKRKCIGIDISSDAVHLAQSRLIDPLKTTSELVKKGRTSYDTSDKAALAFLSGLPIIPVHRNRGIDALLKTKVSDFPVLIRVQRDNETLLEAAEALHSAGQSKMPAKLFLIRTNLTNNFMEDLPDDVSIINSTSFEVLERIADGNLRNPIALP